MGLRLYFLLFVYFIPEFMLPTRHKVRLLPVADCGWRELHCASGLFFGRSGFLVVTGSRSL
jgi:hypothetical protein